MKWLEICHLTTAAFAGIFKKTTHYTFTDFLNQYRINQSKKILLQDKTVTEACYESGFGNFLISIKRFKKMIGKTSIEF
jgi:AraC-like DNA-binding protein